MLPLNEARVVAHVRCTAMPLCEHIRLVDAGDVSLHTELAIKGMLGQGSGKLPTLSFLFVYA